MVGQRPLEPSMEVRILLPEPTSWTRKKSMKLDKSCQLFFGRKIDSKLREALAQAKPGDRRYFEEPDSPQVQDSEFLRIITVQEEQWIGKVVKPGINVTDIEDIQRNVVSILRRIAPDVRMSLSTIKIYALRAESSADSSSGPYIVD